MATEARWVVTANFTEDGAVAWRRSDGAWSRAFADASQHADEEAKALVERARLEPHLVCDPYPAEVRVGDDGAVHPASVRERVRAFGPTIPIPTSR